MKQQMFPGFTAEQSLYRRKGNTLRSQPSKRPAATWSLPRS